MIKIRRTKNINNLLQLNPYNDSDRAKYNDDAVRKAILRNPGAAKDKYRFKEMFQSLHPLSVAVALGASRDVVELIYRAHPIAVEETSYVERTALHWACRFKAPLDVVVFLIDKYPAALQKRSSQGMTPLHHACSDGASVGVIRVLVKWYPDAVEQTDIHGNTPLMLAKRFDAAPEALELLSKAQKSGSRHPRATRTRQKSDHNSDGNVGESPLSPSQVVHKRRYSQTDSADMRWQAAATSKNHTTTPKETRGNVKVFSQGEVCNNGFDKRIAPSA